jgi:hypothetical protein
MAAFFMIYGPDSLYACDRYMFDITDEQKKNFWIAAPYVSSVIALMATIFIGRYYFQIVRPIIKDFKSNLKKLIFLSLKKRKDLSLNDIILALRFFLANKSKYRLTTST